MNLYGPLAQLSFDLFAFHLLLHFPPTITPFHIFCSEVRSLIRGEWTTLQMWIGSGLSLLSSHLLSLALCTVHSCHYTLVHQFYNGSRETEGLQWKKHQIRVWLSSTVFFIEVACFAIVSLVCVPSGCHLLLFGSFVVAVKQTDWHLIILALIKQHQLRRLWAILLKPHKHPY